MRPMDHWEELTSQFSNNNNNMGIDINMHG